MALTTYAELKTAVADWAWGEVTAAQVAADFLPQAQAKMYRGDGLDIEPLRVHAMVSSGTLTPNSGGQVTISTGVDSGWLEFIQITPTTTGYMSLSYLDPWNFQKQQNLLAANGPPLYFTVEGDTLHTAPKGSSIYTLTAQWYQKFTALSADDDADWVLSNAPQVYLNGCLAEAMAYLQDEREAQFRAKFAAAIKGLNLNDRKTRASGAPKRAAPRAVA